MIGQEFDMLTVKEAAPSNRHGQRRWLCECKCGKKKIILSYRLVGRMTKSCGCIRSGNAKKLFTKHGLSGTPEYKVWTSMIQRCHNPNSAGANNYSKKGVEVCQRWRESFENFLADMGPRPNRKMTLERNDSNGTYCPDNCEWANRKKQARNRGVTKMVTHNGVERPLAEWAEITGIARGTLYLRIFCRGWSAEDALTIRPSKKKPYSRPYGLSSLKDQARHAIYLAKRSGTITPPEKCQHDGCTNSKVEAHHHAGYDEKNWLNVIWVCRQHHPKPNEIMVTAHGLTLSAKEWAKRIGISLSAMRSRLRSANWTAEDAVTTQKSKRGSRGLPFPVQSNNRQSYNPDGSSS